MNSFLAKYDNLCNLVNDNLTNYIKKIKGNRENKLYDAMEYSLLAGGKRFRPVLHLAIIDMFGGDIDRFIDTACAIEYIHTYSLIHDDLPCMDNDEFRRGKPTNHIVFGEDIAILAGDGLLNTAYEILFDFACDNNSKNILEGLHKIAIFSGISGMIAGQIVDIESENKKIDLDTLKYLHYNKTGKLILASVLSSADFLDLDDYSKEKLKLYSEKIGFAFQIADDILDVEGKFEDIGKPVGSDNQNNKSTFITHYGLEESKRILLDTIDSAIEDIKFFDNNNFLIDLAKYVASRNG